MKEITAVKINPTDFAPFGTYCSMTEPEGYPLQVVNMYPSFSGVIPVTSTGVPGTV